MDPETSPDKGSGSAPGRSCNKGCVNDDATAPFRHRVRFHGHHEALAIRPLDFKHVAGADGQKLWMSVKTYLALVERQLSRFALLQVAPELVYATLDAPARAPGALELADLEETAPREADYRAQWQAFAGREEALYVACFEAVRPLSAADLERLLGLDGQVQLGALERRYEAALRPKLPTRPRLNPAATIKHLPDGTVGVGAYSDNDALALPREAFALLLEFRGEEPIEALRQRLGDGGINVAR